MTKTSTALAGIVGLLAIAGSALGFGSGTIVLMRGGDATNSQSTLSAGEVPAYLDEYSVSIDALGNATTSLVSSYAIPTSTLTLPGIAQNNHEGRLNLSANGQYLNFAGYQQPVGATTRTTASNGTGSYYQVGQVSAGGIFTSTALDTSVAKPQYMRAAYSINGTQAWVASKNPTGGLEYISNFGTGSAATTALQSTTDWRDIKVSAGQLYGGTGSSSVGTHGFYAIGSGTPTSATPSNTLLTNSSDNSISAFSFATLPAGGAQPINGASGANVVYGIGDPSGNRFIAKLYSPTGSSALTTNNLAFAGGSRLAIPSIPSVEGIIAQPDATNAAWVDLYIQATDGVYFTIDKSGTADGSIAALTFTKIISTTSDTAFYGIAPSPVPAPSAIALVALGGVATGRRRRR
jgi:hypothetical protein